MQIHKLRLSECHQAEGLVVVIDVIRAFTTAAFAFSQGADKIILVGQVDEAFALHVKYPDSLLMGEVDGMPIKGFHYDNSPIAAGKASLRGKTLIFRTSSGTQGVVRSTRAQKILTSSFVIAEATLARIHAINPSKISFIITGTTKGGEEDLALADYIESRLRGENRPVLYLDRVRNSISGKLFASGQHPHFQKHDLDASCDLDRFSFATEVFMEEGYHVLRPVTHTGERWKG